MYRDFSKLDALFGLEPNSPIWYDENDYERTNQPGKHIGWGTEHRHTEESKKLIGSYHKGKVVSEETRRKISEVSKGVPAPNRGGYGTNNVRSVRWILHHECGRVTDIVGIANWCKENGYRRSAIYDIAAGRPGRNRHKDIIKVERLNKS